ncbi:MAG: hypothetical protein JNK58_11915 [Phycisphaerae bacterium]|nr:hypothetical protein [Phycisphaerae bacterium]
MFPRRLIGLASLSLTLGFATNTYAQRRPDPAPLPVYQQAPVPDRYLAQSAPPTPAPVQTTTVIVNQTEPVDSYYARQRYEVPALPPPPQVVYVQPPAPQVVYVQPCPPPVAYCPPPRPVYVCPPARYDCGPSYYGGYRSYYGSGLSLSFSFGDDCRGSSFRYRGGGHYDSGRGHGGGRGGHGGGRGRR